MKIVYIANIRLPTEKAHGIQIMKMCEAFASNGVEVSLVVPRRFNSINDDPFEYYKVKKNFKIIYLPCIDFIGQLGRLGFLLQSFSFAEVVFWWSLFHFFKNRNIVFYSRDELPLFYLTNVRIPAVWEAHMGHLNIFIRTLIRRGIKIVAITNGLKNFYIKHGAKPDNVLIAPDGVDVEQFSIPLSSREAREKVGLSPSHTIVLYTGHLYEWKGADTLARAASYVSPDIHVTFVGGTDKHVEDFKGRYQAIPNISILGKKPHHEMPLYLKSADLLVIPNSAKEEISRSYTSPMKLFEYMASGVPIVASDLPSLREVLDEEMVAFFKPDDHTSLASIITELLSDKERMMRLAQSTQNKIGYYTWNMRAKNIVNFL